MRENKRVLKFRKFKIATLEVCSIVGGTDTNPCNHGSHDTPTSNCPSILTQCTVSEVRTGLNNGCTEGDGADGLNNSQGCRP